MTLKNNLVQGVEPKFEKYVSRLKEPAKRAKQSLEVILEKSIKRYHDQVNKLASKDEKSLYLKKKEKIVNDLSVLKELSEDEIIRYALSVLSKIIKIASNPRIRREERMKARVAAHKPLSTHLFQLKRKLTESEETVSESENEQDTRGSALSKITFNNTIVKMRKDVRRAKVHIIHRLTRNIKKLRMAKGKEEKVAKAQRKAERLHKKVIHIKELHEDDVSKFALSTTQNLTQLATDIKAPSTSQALATVAVNEFVIAHVREFKTKYPDWQKIVPNLKKKKKKRKLNLETNYNKTNSNDRSEANTKSDNDNSESVINHSESENDHSESSDQDKSENESGEESHCSENRVMEDDKPLDAGIIKDKNEKGDISDSDEEVSSSSESEVKRVKNVKNKSLKKAKMTQECFIGKSKASGSKQKSKSGEKVEGKSQSSPNVEAKPAKSKPKAVDPFFVTTTNEEYVTSQVPISREMDLSKEKSDHFKSNHLGKISKFDYKSKWDRTVSSGKYGEFSRFQDSVPYNKPSSINFNKNTHGTRKDKIIFGNRKERRKALQQSKVEENVEKLHPSWEAKKKQSSIIPFQGKKLTFD